MKIGNKQEIFPFPLFILSLPYSLFCYQPFSLLDTYPLSISFLSLAVSVHLIFYLNLSNSYIAISTVIFTFCLLTSIINLPLLFMQPSSSLSIIITNLICTYTHIQAKHHSFLFLFLNPYLHVFFHHSSSLPFCLLFLPYCLL